MARDGEHAIAMAKNSAFNRPTESSPSSNFDIAVRNLSAWITEPWSCGARIVRSTRQGSSWVNRDDRDSGSAAYWRKR